MRKKHIFVGMDAHKNDNVIAIAENGRNKEVRPYGKIPNDLHALEKLVRRIKKAHPDSILHFVYEAGPCRIRHSSKTATT